MGGGHNKFKKINSGRGKGKFVQLVFFCSLFRLQYFQVGGQVGQTNLLIYFFYFNIFLQSIFEFNFFDGGWHQKDNFYLF